jgi:hypothetical protein
MLTTPVVYHVRSSEEAAADQMFEVRDWLIHDLRKYVIAPSKRDAAKQFLADIEAAILDGKIIHTYERTMWIYRASPR